MKCNVMDHTWVTEDVHNLVLAFLCVPFGNKENDELV